MNIKNLPQFVILWILALFAVGMSGCGGGNEIPVIEVTSPPIETITFQNGDVTFTLSGGSHITLSGSAGNLTVGANGGSHAKLAGLAVVNANVKANGGSHVTVNPNGRLDAKASGGSHVTYLGNPTLGAIDEDTSSSVKSE